MSTTPLGETSSKLLPTLKPYGETAPVPSTLKELDTSPYKQAARPSASLLMSPIKAARPQTKKEREAAMKRRVGARAKFVMDIDPGSEDEDSEDGEDGAGHTHKHGDTLGKSRRCHKCDDEEGYRPPSAGGRGVRPSSGSRRTFDETTATKVTVPEPDVDHPTFLKKWDPSHKDMTKTLRRYPFFSCVACRKVLPPTFVEGLEPCPRGVNGHVLKPLKLGELSGLRVRDGHPDDPATKSVPALDMLQALPLRVDHAESIAKSVTSKMHTIERLMTEVTELRQEAKDLVWAVPTKTRLRVLQSMETPSRPNLHAMMLSMRECLDRLDDPGWAKARRKTEMELFHDNFMRPLSRK